MAKTAPGRSNRKGISLIKLMKMFPNDAAAEKWFIKNRWPDSPHCPYCGSVNVQSGAKHKTMPFRCRERECRKRFSVRTSTPMECSNLGYQIWAFAIYMLTTNLKGVSSMKLHRDLEITQKSAWFLAHRLRKALADDGFEWPFMGPVEVDETYMGGKRKNMPGGKRRMLKGRGSVGKTAVIGMRDRATNNVTARVVENTDRDTLHGFVETHAAPDARVFTDDAIAYKGMDREHEAVNHSIGEYVRGMAHTNGIESFWAMLKRGHKGTFHKISQKHLARYVNEFAGRHNIRGTDTIDQMGIIVRQSVGKRLRYRELVA